MTRNGLAQLKNIHGLKQLDLRTTLLDDEAAQSLRDIKTLEVFDVRHTLITDDGMNEVAQISTLRSLHVAGQRNVVERLVGWLKESRRIFSRFEKTTKNFGGMLKMAFI